MLQNIKGINNLFVLDHSFSIGTLPLIAKKPEIIINKGTATLQNESIRLDKIKLLEKGIDEYL
jgi:hypothetical protein